MTAFGFLKAYVSSFEPFLGRDFDGEPSNEPLLGRDTEEESEDESLLGLEPEGW